MKFRMVETLMKNFGFRMRRYDNMHPSTLYVDELQLNWLVLGSPS